MATTTFGTDVSTFPGLDVNGRQISEARAMAEWALRCLTTAPGDLSYDPEWGHDLRDLLNEDLDDRDLRRHESLSETALERDERVARADVQLSLEKSTFTLTVRIGGTLVTGRKFNLVLAIDQVTASVLKAE
jgi:hypothetical protein